MMKHVLVLVVLVCAAFAAPAEDKDLKTVGGALNVAAVVYCTDQNFPFGG